MISQSEIKYNRLMKKAEELFIDLGYKAVSMDQIAEAAGISKMTIYKYHSSKEELFLSVLQSISEKTYKDLESRIKSIDGALEKIDVLLNFNIEYSKKYSIAFLKDIMDNPYIADRIMQEEKRITKTIFQDIIRNGIKTGEIRDVDEDFLVAILMALIDGLGQHFFDTITCKEEMDDFTKKFYDFLKYGLLGDKGVK